MKKIIVALAIALTITSPPATAAGPKTSAAGGIGSSTSTYSAGEPVGGTYSINGSTGTATFGGLNLPSSSANKVFATPSGSAGIPSFRALTPLDVPTLNQNTTGTSANITGALANSNLAPMVAGTVKANITGATALPADVSMASLDLAMSDKCRNVLSYGADKTGTVDSLAAFNAAVAASNQLRICVYFPTGTYKFSGTPTVSSTVGNPYASVTIRGDGSENTLFTYTTADTIGIKINLNGANQSFHISNISVLAPNASTTNTGIYIQGASSGTSAMQSEISNVTIRGSDGYNLTNRFFNGVYFQNVSNINLINDAIFGTTVGGSAGYASIGNGLVITGTAAALPIQFDVASSQINFYGNGILYGPYAQGLQVSNSNFTGNGTAIIVQSGQVGNDELVVSGSQFNSGVRNIYVQSPLDGVAITGNMFYTANTATASLDLFGGQNNITGNTLIQFAGGTPSTGISINAYSLDSSVVSANAFANFAAAINLGTGADRVVVSGNSYNNVSSRINNGSTAANNDIQDGVAVAASGVGGLGTGGAISLEGSSDSLAGSIHLTAGSSGTTATGNFTLSFATAAPNRWICMMTANDTINAWTNPNFGVSFAARTSVTVFWTNASALSANGGYYIYYSCTPR